MDRRAFLVFAGQFPALWAAKKSKAKGPEIELIEAAAKLEEGKLAIDGRFRNVSQRSIHRITVIYELLDSDKNALTRQKGAIDQEQLDTSEEAEFHVQMAVHARAVSFRLSFEDGGERELNAVNTGPFPVE